jgi:putative hydrolase of the HAD superfamily
VKRGTILWDFDGTLVRSVFMWSRAALAVLDEHVPGHGSALVNLRQGLQADFPWHHPEVAHLELNEPSAWWAHMEPMFARAFVDLGLSPAQAWRLAGFIRAKVVDPVGYVPFAEAAPTLERLRAAGWRHAILSNHVPELPQIVAGLGWTPYFDAIHSSALTGFEKPHTEAFTIALAAAREAGHPARWMVGDNAVADAQGARGVGLAAVLVGGSRDAEYPWAPDLPAVADLILVHG